MASGRPGRYSQIGIDIGSACIKMIQFRHSRGRISLYRKAISFTPAETFKDGNIINPALLAEELKRLKEKESWHKNKVNLCLNPQAFYLRRVKLPIMKDKEIQKALFWEVEKHFAIPAKEAIFDFCPAGELKVNGTACDYLLAAVSKNTADTYTSAAKEAGLVSASLEILPLTLCRSMQNSLQLQNFKRSINSTAKPAALKVLLDIGFSNSTIIIMHGSEYLFYRSIKKGIDHFCRALLKENSDNYRSSYQRVYEKASLKARGLLKAADQYASQVSQSLAYWADRSEYPVSTLYSIQFCGGGAFIPGLASHIEQTLSLKRYLYNPLAPLTGSKPGTQPDLYREESLFPAAHGLALRGWIK